MPEVWMGWVAVGSERRICRAGDFSVYLLLTTKVRNGY